MHDAAISQISSESVGGPSLRPAPITIYLQAGGLGLAPTGSQLAMPKPRPGAKQALGFETFDDC